MTFNVLVLGNDHKRRTISPPTNARTPNGWYRRAAGTSSRINERTERVIPQSGQGTPVIVSIGQGGIGEKGSTMPKTARPTHPRTNHRSGASGTAIDVVKRDRCGPHEDVCA